MSGVSGLVRFDGGPVSPGWAVAAGRILSLRPEVQTVRAMDDGWCGQMHRNPLRHRGDGRMTADLLPGIDGASSVDGPFLLSGGRWFVGEAVIKDRDRLAAALEIGGDVAEIGDAPLLAAAVARWGADACLHLEGLFAYALWSPAIRRLELVRDRIGEFTLFHATAPGVAAFATLPGGLLDLPFVDDHADEAALARLVMDLPRTQDETLFPQIRQCLPATVTTIDSDGVHSRPYWAMDTSLRLTLRRRADYAEAMREQLARATSFRLRVEGCGRIGAMLSGGLDSTAVAATAASLLAGRGEALIAVTSVPSADDLARLGHGFDRDEILRAAAAAARWPNIQHHQVDAAGVGWGDGVDDHQMVLGEPIRSSGRWYTLNPLFNRCVESGVGVLLGGQSGNYNISYNGAHYFRHLIHRRAWGRLALVLLTTPRRPRAVACELRDAMAGAERLRRIQEAQTRRGQRLDRRLKRHWIPVNADWLAAQGIRPDEAADTLLDNPALDGTGGDPAAILWGQYVSQPQRLDGWVNAALRAQYGFEMRDPTHDVDLWRFCLSIPPDMSWHPWNKRRLIRQAMAGLLPARVLGQRRNGGFAVAGALRMADSRPVLEDRVARIASSGLAGRVFAPTAMNAMIDDLGRTGGAKDGPRAAMGLSPALSIGGYLDWLERGRPMNGLRDARLTTAGGDVATTFQSTAVQEGQGRS